MRTFTAAATLGLLALITCLFIVHKTFTFALGAGFVAGGIGWVLLAERQARSGDAEKGMRSQSPSAEETREPR